MEFVKGNIKLINADWMDMLQTYPDNYFDLAVVDPEFGINIANSPRLVLDKGLKGKEWDKSTPPKEYFTQLFRISRSQIIWGGNYFELGITKHCIIWDKKQPEKLSFGMFDFAWTSFEKPNKIFYYHVQNEKNKIHPTQKPVMLYKWILHNYADIGFKVLDTHLGSGSSAIAAHYFGCEFTGIELDKEYFDASVKRFKEQTMQQKLF